MLKGGLGSASLILDNGATVAALVAKNPIGNVTTPGDRHFWAAPFEIDAEYGGIGTDPTAGLGRDLNSRKMNAISERANTTIAVVATDMTLDKAQCQRIAIAAHDGIGRAVVPAHMPGDGDSVFALPTGEHAIQVPDQDVMLIGHAAALCLSRAIARAVFEATPAKGDLLPCWKTSNSF